MGEISILESLCSLGVGAVLGIAIFLMYRRDKEASEKRIADICAGHEKQLIGYREDMLKIINRDQESREKNTEAITELTILLRKMNGKRSE